MRIKEFYDRYIDDPGFRWSSVYGELKELIAPDSFSNFLEELNDVSFTLQIKLFVLTKINFPMIWPGPSIAKMEDRLIFWKSYFESHGLEFKPYYWRNGSNYKKQHKLDRGIELAKKVLQCK